MTTLVVMVNRSSNPNLKKIAADLGVSLSTVYKLLQGIKNGDLIHNNKVVLPAKVKGRRRKANGSTVAMVKDILTETKR